MHLNLRLAGGEEEGGGRFCAPTKVFRKFLKNGGAFLGTAHYAYHPHRV